MEEQQAASLSLPNSAGPSNETTDPLVAVAAKKIADVINDLKRGFHQRDGTWPQAQGYLVLDPKTGHDSQTFNLFITPNVDGDEHPVAVRATFKKPKVITITIDGNTASSTRPDLRPTRRASDAGLEKGNASRRRRERDDGDGDDATNKRPRTIEDRDDEDITGMPLTTKEHLDGSLATLRQNIQEDTAETVSHVHRLLWLFKEDWHKQIKSVSEQSQAQLIGAPSRNTINASGGLGGSSPSHDVVCDETNVSIADVVRQEARLISKQIQWANDCRQGANDEVIKGEDKWRTSSSTYHDQQRQDREKFQNRILRESSMQAHTLSEIRREVKALVGYAQKSNSKWEMKNIPDTDSTQPALVAIPTQSAQRMRTQTAASRQTNQPHQQ